MVSPPHLFRCLVASQMCGGFNYSLSKELCCGNRIHVIPHDLGRFACCGSDLLPIDGTSECCAGEKLEKDDVCCSNSKHPRKDGYECCGREYYDVNSQTCCGGHTVLSGLGSCCGATQVYDQSTQLCCPFNDSHLVHRVGENEILLGDAQCCGNTWINSTSICCDGEVYPRDGPAACHGNLKFNPTTHLVCGGKLLAIIEGKNQCCTEGFQSRLFNPDVECCCSDSSFTSPYSCCSMANYDPANSSCIGGEKKMDFPEVNGRENLWKICGDEVYPVTSQICCPVQNNTFPRYADSACCGSVSYRKTTQFCINDRVVDKMTEQSKICSEGLATQYDPHTQTCCRHRNNDSYSRIFNRTSGTCCVINETEVILTDPSVQTCCEVWNGNSYAKVWDVPEAPERCCGTDIPISGEQLCDLPLQEIVNLTPSRLEDDAVCAPLQRHNNANFRQTYNSQKEICTRDGFIMPKVEGKGVCNGIVYELERQGCCDGQVYTLYMEQCCLGYLVKPRYNQELRPLQCCENGAVYNNETESCISARIWPFPEANAGKCGTTRYDDLKYSCLDNKLVPHGAPQGISFCGNPGGAEQPAEYDESEQECCGGQLIGPGQTCCDGNIHSTPGTPLRGGKCCVYKAYNPASQVCCLDQIHDGSENTTACCREKAYNTALSNITCCGGKLQRRSAEDTECSEEHGIVHRPDEVVCDKIKRRLNGDHEQCCGTELYNTLNEHCCEGFRFNKTGVSACCGKQAYAKTDSRICCDRVLHDSAEGRECCGHSYYDNTTQECFSSGGKQYVVPKEGKARHAFCNAGSFNSTNQTCCDGLLYNGIVECCGNKAIMDQMTLCCNGQVHMMIYGSNTECCPSGKIINQLVESCDEQVGEHGWPLCNGTEYFPYTHGCCSGKIYSKDEATCKKGEILHSCNGVQYSKAEQTCCNGSLTDIGNGSCCGTRAFDPSDKMCCGTRLHSNPEGHKQCCRSRAFNPQTEMCCHYGRVLRLKNPQMRQPRRCCRKGFEPSMVFRRCQAIYPPCRGLARDSNWQEVRNDCSKTLAFRFTVSNISATAAEVLVRDIHHPLHRSSNVQIDALVFPPQMLCSQMKEGEEYMLLSSGEIFSHKLHLRDDDYLGRNPMLTLKRLLNGQCFTR